MYIDSSRIRDLIQLKEWMNDPTMSIPRKQMFKRTYDKIISQLNDRKLAQMRERLTKATFAEDKVDMWKITNQIKDYSKEERVAEFHD